MFPKNIQKDIRYDSFKGKHSPYKSLIFQCTNTMFVIMVFAQLYPHKTDRINKYY